MAAQVEAVKWVPGTKFIVDGFRFQSPACAAYFLTCAPRALCALRLPPASSHCLVCSMLVLLQLQPH